MYHPQRFLIIWIACYITLFPVMAQGNSPTSSIPDKPPVTEKVKTILAKVTPRLKEELTVKGLRLGSPVFIRIFKMPAELEVWVSKKGRYELFKTYPICDFSGYPGPKTHEGDWQSPEGFYSVNAEQMNPLSSYHLSFDIGYPNEYDSLRKRNGGNIMVHGSCSSMGCFAMTNYRIEEIYALVHNALSNGQKEAGVHVFPFRMTDNNMKKFRFSPWTGFWKNLKVGFDEFDRTRLVPHIRVANGRYVVTTTSELAMRDGKQLRPTPFPATSQNYQ